MPPSYPNASKLRARTAKGKQVSKGGSESDSENSASSQSHGLWGEG